MNSYQHQGPRYHQDAAGSRYQLVLVNGQPLAVFEDGRRVWHAELIRDQSPLQQQALQTGTGGLATTAK